MHKLFFEAIPGLEMNEKMRAALEDVWVDKVTQSRDLRVLHIHLESEHLIHKKMIYTLEGMIKQQLFPQRQVIIQIVEHYRLSAQYTDRRRNNYASGTLRR